MNEARCSGVLVVLTTALLLAGCSAVADGPTETPHLLAKFPFDPNAKWVVLPVTLEGEQYRFILDTGCTRTIFDTSLRDRLGKRFLWPRKYEAADGEQFTVEYFHAPEAYVGPLQMASYDLITVADVPTTLVGIDGILGMKFLKHYAVQIDPDRGLVRFFKSQKGVVRPHWGHEIRMKRGFRSSLPYVRGQVNGAKARFLVDTGFTSTLSGSLEKDVFEKVRSESAGYEHHSTVSNMAQGATPRSGLVVLPDELSLNGYVLEDTAFCKAYRSLLGLPFFSGHIVTFDFPNDTLYLRPARNQTPWGGSQFGLGRLGFRLSRRHDGLSVCSVDPNGMAQSKGIKQGDLLLEVDGRDVRGFTPIEFVRFMVQRRNSQDESPLALTFARGDAVHHIFFTESDLVSKKEGINKCLPE